MIRAAHAGFGVAAIVAVAYIRFLSSVVTTALRHVNFAANDGLDVALAGIVKEIGSGKEIAVIGDGHGGHLLAGRFIQELGGLASPVEQTVIGVNVKMNELRLTHGTRF